MEPAIDRALTERDDILIKISPRRIVVGANLGLAVISDFVFPAVGYFNAFCTSLLNYRNVGKAWAALRQGTFTLSALHSMMYGMGLIAFEWIGDAVMYWTGEYWPRRIKRLRQESERQFLSRYRGCPRRVWVMRGGAEIEVNLTAVQKDEIVILRPGDIVPGDGVVVSGKGAVLDHWITGVDGASPKKPRDPIYASSEIVEGELHMRIVAMGDHTIASRLAEWFEEVFKKPHPRTQASELGETMALPTFLLSIASLHRGGIAMAKAVGHPDFRSGPGIAAEISDLAATLARPERSAFTSLLPKRSPRSAMLIASSSMTALPPGIAAATAMTPSTPSATACGSLGVQEVVLLSHRPAEEIADLAAKIGVDAFHGRQSAVEKTGFIEQRRLLERKIAYFGDMGPDKAVAAAADVAIAVAAVDESVLPEAAILLRQPDLEKAVLLRLMSQESRKMRRAGVQTAMAFNVACMFGALFLSLPILAVVGLTNSGHLLHLSP